MQRKCISTVLSENLTKHTPNIYPNVFNSLHRTVTYGEFHGIFMGFYFIGLQNATEVTQLFPFVAFPFFFISTLQTPSPLTLFYRFKENSLF